MFEAICVAYYEGRVLCAFVDREEVKRYLKEHHSTIDPFDVSIKSQFLSDSNPKFGR
ncbi:hypothetical protein b3_0130 [Synechococcus phage B3]|nr:hypothetical protein b3_0130 [Synechococcus phage B3]QGT54744.1 hypothetical protein b23_0129 [Synechococcus phage B23]